MDTASPFHVFNFHLQFVCVAFGPEPLKFSEFGSAGCVWHVCLQGTWKNQGARFTNTANLPAASTQFPRNFNLVPLSGCWSTV